MKISFFASKSFLGSQIRGQQIAEYLKGKYNPTEGYEKDLLIYVKPPTLNMVRDIDWVDVSDGYWVPGLLKDRPKVSVIAHSLYSYEHLRGELKNPMRWISQQHLNWERARREPREMRVCGYIAGAAHKSCKVCREIDERLNRIGIEWRTCFDFRTRQDCINFYKSIDLLVIGPEPDFYPYKTPTKMINAASFGIPTIAQRMQGYKEWEGNYVHADTVPEIINEVQRFTDSAYYEEWADRLIRQSEYYHISKVAERYKELAA